MNHSPNQLACVTFLILIAYACCGQPTIAVQSSPNQFVDVTETLGLKLSGSAACWADLNQDGWPDLCCGGVVWKNEAGKRFTQLAEGLGNVVAADFDNDGFVDLFSYSSLQLYRNDRGKQFNPVELPKLPSCVSLAACWGDFNRDGFVDLYIAGYEDWETQTTYPDLVLWNEQGQRFELEELKSQSRARGVSACDFDQDHDLDIYVSNYRLQPNLLWANNGAGKLNNVATERNAVATSAGFAGGHSIGSVWADFDDDGRFDLFAGNFAHRDSRGDQPQSRFLRNQGPKNNFAFEDKGTCGVFYQESYASPAAADFDNDGDVDLFFTTVYGTASFGRKNHSVMFRNEGSFSFSDVTQTLSLNDLPPTYQAAWADFDRDGFVDLVTANRLFRNASTGGNWLTLQLLGDGKTINRSAIGTVVQVFLPNRVLTRQVEAGTGQGNQNDLTLHFGLGAQSEDVELKIIWPNGTTETKNYAVDQAATIRFGQGPQQQD